jgi:hypothetical protein
VRSWRPSLNFRFQADAPDNGQAACHPTAPIPTGLETAGVGHIRPLLSEARGWSPQPTRAALAGQRIRRSDASGNVLNLFPIRAEVGRASAPMRRAKEGDQRWHRHVLTAAFARLRQHFEFWAGRVRPRSGLAMPDSTALSGIIAAWADHPNSAPIRMPSFPRGSSRSSVNW